MNIAKKIESDSTHCYKNG